ncbi:hypothetical protein [Chondromyces apiculatus]|uniref:hypothetical protein n=1 Tax=Chondromyces apiculatus TaxID=51 RepID=UPI001E424DD2|nr:hypothetical protein [Chondromyces apiculatus]
MPPLRTLSAPLAAAAAAAALLALLPACSRSTPAEPEAGPTASAASAPAVPPLQWDVPAGWTVVDAPRGGPQKASYKVPRAANDKEDVEVLALFHGTGSQGDVEKNFKAWLDQFDGDVASTARRSTFTVRGMQVDMVEVTGTYKVALGPPMGPKKKAAVEMVKKGYRLLGAAVRTGDRGNWFFKVTGPDETVQSTRSALQALLESARP